MHRCILAIQQIQGVASAELVKIAAKNFFSRAVKKIPRKDSFQWLPLQHPEPAQTYKSKRDLPGLIAPPSPDARNLEFCLANILLQLNIPV